MEDEAVLDLLAHFLGLATHDNIDAPPSWAGKAGRRRPEVSLAEGARARAGLSYPAIFLN